MANTPLRRGLACPINLTPNCFTAEVGLPGSDFAGKLSLGVIVNPTGGILCGPNGLEIDCCVVQQCQFNKKYTEIFAPPRKFSDGIQGSGSGFLPSRCTPHCSTFNIKSGAYVHVSTVP